MRKEKIIETIVYGIISSLFMMAFFFGLMYPEYGLADANSSYSVYAQGEEYCGRSLSSYEKRESRDVPDVDYLGKIGCHAELERLQKLKKEDKVIYTSYIYECFKRKS